MVPASEAQQRAIIPLKTIDLMLDDLAEVAREWTQLSEGERVSWSMDWSNEMSALERLTREAEAGLLTTSQQDCVRELIAKTTAATPVLRQLDLCRPVLMHE